MAETKEYLDYTGLSEYHKKSKGLFQDLTIQDVEEAFNELDESDPSYSAFYDVIQKAKEATTNADSKAAAAVTATNNANTATSNADKATERANKAAEKLEVVNDMTTGINLLRGTRDFLAGSILGKSPRSYIDGFSFVGGSTNLSFYKRDDGFTIMRLARSGASEASSRYVRSSIVEVKTNETYTINFECMVEDIAAVDGSQNIAVINIYNASDGLARQKVLHLTDIPGVTFKSGEWVQIVADITSNVDGFLFLEANLNKNGAINYCKPMIEINKINNPIYSVSPLDMVLEPVNDITTGINLVKYSRDFRNATIFGKNSPYGSEYYDGFGFNNKSADGKHIFEFLRDEQGFMTVHMACSGLTADDEQYVESNTFEVTRGKTYTYYCDFLVDDMAALDNQTCCRAYGVVKGESNWISLALLDLTDVVVGGKIENKVWCRAVFQFTPTNVDIVMTRFTLRRNGSIYVRKMGVCEGNIIRPEWSMSPFDIATANVETDGFIYRGVPKSNDFDSVVIQGNYIINKGANYYKNDPHASHGYGQLLVFVASTYVIQIRISNSADVNLRPKWRASALLGEQWSNWSPFSTS